MAENSRLARFGLLPADRPPTQFFRFQGAGRSRLFYVSIPLAADFQCNR
ncbi:hypothetical protein QNH18_20230 [Bacillus paralicheniformis]|uniref:Uncharacterized protein n=1 Tax=Bacillus paralicheniformis TaxID=1648923 RepID=A0ABY3FRT8_9BACI|nr:MULTISPECIES: hypothetical protein [Bacillus]KUL18294.1 hypothetical protein LI6934_07355 [Bacillus licheniformis LMG 6934]MBC8621708.1 hypothetical protein [Robertmurraya crescens]AJO20382.1 hypothetical protein SC10_B2orf05983 [Bacillus paralicheniformis]MBU5328218.1 hypothetical protein [Bacillus paralicheniformis]MBU8698765.1 hypothetical protein [Bacillus paralicheniformis]